MFYPAAGAINQTQKMQLNKAAGNNQQDQTWLLDEETRMK